VIWSLTCPELSPAFQGIDKAHQLQVVSGKPALDLHWNHTRAFRILLLVPHLLHPDAVLRRQFPQGGEQLGILRGEPVFVKSVDLILRQHDFLVHTAQRFYFPILLGQCGPEFVDLQRP
jgi:hypothetical protein